MTNYAEHRILGRKASSPTRRQFLLTRTEVKILRRKKEDAASFPCLGVKVLTHPQAKRLRQNPWAINQDIMERNCLNLYIVEIIMVTSKILYFNYLHLTHAYMCI